MSKEEEYEEVYDERSALMEFYLVNICGTKPEVARREVVMKIKKQKENNNEQDNFKESYNVHDPYEQYVWADDDLPWWARVLYGVAFLGFIAAIVIFGLLL